MLAKLWCATRWHKWKREWGHVSQYEENRGLQWNRDIRKYSVYLRVYSSLGIFMSSDVKANFRQNYKLRTKILHQLTLSLLNMKIYLSLVEPLHADWYWSCALTELCSRIYRIVLHIYKFM
jgi:hypothetical protein